MDNKSNIYKSKPEFIKEGFDPFSVQVLKSSPLPPPSVNMFWRTPEDWSFSYAVDSEGRLILANWDDDTDDKVLAHNDEDGYLITSRSDVSVPELNTWGNSPKKATLGGDNDVEITYDGQNFVMANDCSTFTPELQDYQEGEALLLPPPNWAWRTDDNFSNRQWLVDNDNGALITIGVQAVSREQEEYIIVSPQNAAPNQWERVNGELLSFEEPIELKGRYEGRIIEVVLDEPSDLNVLTPEITAIYQP